MARVRRLALESIKKGIHSKLSAADLVTQSDLEILDTGLAGATEESRVYVTATSPLQATVMENDHAPVKS